jgi:pimeloyl-ACP methyl ester carboxylesterase
MNWHRRCLVDQKGLLEPPEDGGKSVEQLQQAPRPSSVQTAPRTTQTPGHLRSRSSEQHPPAHSTASESKSPIRGHKKGNLGLRLVSDNPAHDGDLIFVHGLGGNATTTWCWNRDPKYFWPSWLANEENLSSYRVFTFGYDSNFARTDANLNIIDFAKDLLFQMLTFSGGSRKRCRPIGGRPIIFVCHSMGGLVVKKAFVLGLHDMAFSRILSWVHGIVFLATPHRGSQYVKTLNLILSSIPVVTSRKSCVADLNPKSTALQDINEQFRMACGKLELFSFVETLKTMGLEV